MSDTPKKSTAAIVALSFVGFFLAPLDVIGGGLYYANRWRKAKQHDEIAAVNHYDPHSTDNWGRIGSLVGTGTGIVLSFFFPPLMLVLIPAGVYGGRFLGACAGAARDKYVIHKKLSHILGGDNTKASNLLDSKGLATTAKMVKRILAVSVLGTGGIEWLRQPTSLQIKEAEAAAEAAKEAAKTEKAAAKTASNSGHNGSNVITNLYDSIRLRTR